MLVLFRPSQPVQHYCSRTFLVVANNVELLLTGGWVGRVLIWGHFGSRSKLDSPPTHPVRLTITLLLPPGCTLSAEASPRRRVAAHKVQWTFLRWFVEGGASAPGQAWRLARALYSAA